MSNRPIVGKCSEDLKYVFEEYFKNGMFGGGGELVDLENESLTIDFRDLEILFKAACGPNKRDICYFWDDMKNKGLCQNV